MRVRTVPESNYKAVFTPDGVTLRYKIDQSQDFKPLKRPDLLDIALNDKCYGNCPECYTSAVSSGRNFPDILPIWERMMEPLNDHRPFQVAIGGAGEPTLHPDFCEFLKLCRRLDIMPNYTTNGMHLSDKILDYTKEYCGGVAVSTHKHLKWEKAAEKLLSKKVRTNLHIIVGAAGSFDYLEKCFQSFPDVETFVILPYQAQGRGISISESILHEEWSKAAALVQHNKGTKFAFGALMYPFIMNNLDRFQGVNTYEPEMFSGYVLLNEENPPVRKSSYNLQPK